MSTIPRNKAFTTDSIILVARYMLAEDHQTLYVAFIGTKQRRDLVANAAVLQVPFWPDPSDKLVSLDAISLLCQTRC